MSQRPSIGVVSPFLSGFYFGALLAGIHAVVKRHGLRLIAIQGSPRDVAASRLAGDHVAGWIVILDTQGIEQLAQMQLPLVTISAVASALDCPSVLPDNFGGMQAAVRHLIEHGHRRIAFVGDLTQTDIEQRFAGYQAALADHGIPFDPDLVYASDDNLAGGGRAAAQRLLQMGLPCTAVAAATDENALGALAVLREAGYRIPADLAIVGFDDTAAAQAATPPLTTVRQRFDAIGSTAAQLLLSQIAGRPVPAGSTYVATALIPRRSCGCGGDLIALAPAPLSSSIGPDWQAALARQLVQRVLHPLPLDPETPPAQVWPGVTTIVDALEAAVRGGPLPAADRLEQAWQEAIELTPDIETLMTTLKLLEHAAAQCARAATDTAAQARLEGLLDRARLTLMYARLAGERARGNALEHLSHISQQISITLLRGDGQSAKQLAWLAQTEARWGCLALWEGEAADTATTLRVVGAYSQADDPLPPIAGRYAAPAFPPVDLLPPSAREDGPDMLMLLPIRTATHNWGVLALVEPFLRQRFFTRDPLDAWVTMLGAVLEREALLASITDQQETLRLAYERERALADTVRELGCPVIPLLPGVLLVPLVGALDSSRASQVIEAILQGVSTHQATEVLLDVTGVPLVDTQVANSLLQAARAATLLGAHVVLVGIRPEIAQSIVGLGIDLSHLTTRSSLAAALQGIGKEKRYAPPAAARKT
jgi:DNA-binding LacI/PurR family transcriptional regulator/anti-anti-sigma regulatory factor